MAYESQSFPIQPPSAFIPPKDYPTRDVVSGHRPRSPPVDYAIFNGYSPAEAYPFRGAPRWGYVRQEQNEAVQFEQPEMLPPPISPKNNKAFQLHMKNHGKFNTVKGGYPSCENCPICKAMNVADEELTKPKQRQTRREVYEPVDEEEEDYEDFPVHHHQVQKPKRRPARRSVQDYYDQERFPEQDRSNDEYRKERRQIDFRKELKSRHAVVAHVNSDRVARNHQELTVFKGEFLEVLDNSNRWWECCNVAGRTGFVPHTILDTLFS